MTELFNQICLKLQAVDCSFKRYVKPEQLAAGLAQDYSNMNGRVQTTFEDIHLLIAAIQAGNQQAIKEQWHILSNGQIKSL